MLPTNNGSTKDVQPPVVQDQPPVVQDQPHVPHSEPVAALVPNLKQTISYPSRRNDERRREKANDQIEKFYEIFKDLSFEISLTDALILMPKFASTLKALIGNKEKLSEMARTPLNEHCSAVILNKLPEKLGDPGKFLIPCDFPGMDECLALADLGASINLMPLSVWKRLSLPELTPTCMTLELADRSITQPIGELTFHVGKEVVTFNLDQTSRYSSNYDDMTANRIDVIEMACEEYSQEVLGFSNLIASGNPTPYYDPIVSTSSPTLTPFRDSDFLLLEEADAFLALEDDPTSPEVKDSYYDSEGDCDNATYCAFVEDIAVQYCFFDILLTSLSPRNCIPPEVLLRVSMHSACSTSKNALEKPLDIRKLDNSSYQALGACFKPYKAFLKRRVPRLVVCRTSKVHPALLRSMQNQPLPPYCSLVLLYSL
ncbi:reverse transcriptase domain-containing protein, partial [Tanacetum coccineum]